MKKDKKTRTMDVILLALAIFLISFTAVLLWLYYSTGGIPDTLCTCVFTACGGECGIMGWIKTTKDKYATSQDDTSKPEKSPRED